MWCMVLVLFGFTSLMQICLIIHTDQSCHVSARSTLTSIMYVLKIQELIDFARKFPGTFNVQVERNTELGRSNRYVGGFFYFFRTSIRLWVSDFLPLHKQWSRYLVWFIVPCHAQISCDAVSTLNLMLAKKPRPSVLHDLHWLAHHSSSDCALAPAFRLGQG